MSGREMNDLWLSSQSHSALAKAAAAQNASQRDEKDCATVTQGLPEETLPLLPGKD